MNNYGRRVTKAFRVMHPRKKTAQGSRAWFWRRCLRWRMSGLDVTHRTVTRWLTDSDKKNVLPPAGVVLLERIEAEAEEMKAARAEVSRLERKNG